MRKGCLALGSDAVGSGQKVVLTENERSVAV
jgi:hypothetical protein